MIEYEFGTWGVHFAWALKGSVLLRALVWAVPAALLAVVYHWLFCLRWGSAENYSDVTGTSSTNAWLGYTLIVGFLVVCRTQIACFRFWEGAKAIWSVKGMWVNVVSNTLAFTTTEPASKMEADSFQHFLVRLMSMLFSACLESLATAEVKSSCSGDIDIDQQHLDHLRCAHDKAGLILAWIQRLIVEQHHNGILTIPSPILSQVFQELGQGTRDFQSARQMKKCYFPFPYAQALSILLMAEWLLLPVIAAYSMPHQIEASCLTFVIVFALWSVNYVAAELETPFNDNPNSLPLGDVQRDFDDCMRMLMHPTSRVPPTFIYNEEKHAHLCKHRRQPHSPSKEPLPLDQVYGMLFAARMKPTVLVKKNLAGRTQLPEESGPKFPTASKLPTSSRLAGQEEVRLEDPPPAVCCGSWEQVGSGDLASPTAPTVWFCSDGSTPIPTLAQDAYHAQQAEWWPQETTPPAAARREQSRPGGQELQCCRLPCQRGAGTVPPEHHTYNEDEVCVPDACHEATTLTKLSRV
eukprot:TRINITY_DN102379_c0_g1_i1.p1 TRINITY_DN102379_c0_g1~~TRINITY_DN102379_c0_g1_i1.p1  ORF type:complete len:522 (-),score=72.20 TRINITY_DN102379_c0_g1_i1:456-2021(-)